MKKRAAHSQSLPFHYRPSPHADARPLESGIDLLVIHAISLPPGCFGGRDVENLFLGRLDFDVHPFFQTIRDVRVSAHFFLDRRGILTQFVPVGQRAWHAGVSAWRGRTRCNDFSVGIELEGTADRSFEPIQYRCLATLFHQLMSGLPDVNLSRVVGHEHIAPERRWDPGPRFDWCHFRHLCQLGEEESAQSAWPLVW
jgi:AmpD protein